MRLLLAAALLSAACLPVLRAEAGAPAGQGPSVSSEFIRIRVNPGPQEAGRFAIDTTGGDPSRTADDNKVLIYGSGQPWTSYTTVLVDDQPFAFGGPTARRAGKELGVGAVTAPREADSKTITCATRLGDIEVKQELGLARSTTTRVEDAARIAYVVTNRGDSAHAVGLRLVLDTMLGSNDGAPLRAGDQAITGAVELAGQRLPDYWQAFDSLSHPEVISQGTLRAPGLTPPDRMRMADWGTLADSPWDFPLTSGAGFTRRGEEAQDTAVALYWEPVTLKPGESRAVSTLYGVGGVSLSPAQLSLGLTAPAEVDYQYEDARPFSVVAYIENSGGFDSRATTCALELPKGLKLVEGEAEVPFGLLKPGETRQASWRVTPTGEGEGSLKLAAAVTSENLEPNRVEREIVVNSPPQLMLKVTAPGNLAVTSQNRYSPNPFPVEVSVTNAGAQTARSVVVTLSLADGLRLLAEEAATQTSDRLDRGKQQSFKWQVRATGSPAGELALTVRASAAGAKPATAKHVVLAPELTPEIRVHPAEQAVPLLTDGKPTLVPVVVQLAPAREFLGCRVSVSFDPSVVVPLYIARGEAFVEGGRLLSPWSAGQAEQGRISGIGGERGEAPALNAPEAALFTVVFMTRGTGQSEVGLELESVAGRPGGRSSFRILAGEVTVKAMEDGQ
jgi:hypothetical protein